MSRTRNAPAQPTPQPPEQPPGPTQFDVRAARRRGVDAATAARQRRAIEQMLLQGTDQHEIIDFMVSAEGMNEHTVKAHINRVRKRWKEQDAQRQYEYRAVQNRRLEQLLRRQNEVRQAARDMINEGAKQQGQPGGHEPEVLLRAMRTETHAIAAMTRIEAELAQLNGTRDLGEQVVDAPTELEQGVKAILSQLSPARIAELGAAYRARLDAAE